MKGGRGLVWRGQSRDFQPVKFFCGLVEKLYAIAEENGILRRVESNPCHVREREKAKSLRGLPQEAY